MQIVMRTLVALLVFPTLAFAAQETGQKTGLDAGILIDDLPGDQAETIWAWTQDLLDQGKAAGASAQIVRKGKVVYRGVHGELELASGRLVQSDSLFRIYSMTKAITSVAFMQLVEQGKLKLDEPISKYLPEWEKVTVLQKNEDNTWGEVATTTPITARHLLRHTSGLTSVGLRSREAARQGPLHSLEDLSKRLADLPLKHQPGEAWTYGHSTNVLGRLIEVVAEQPFDTYVQEQILDPLGMVDTSFRVTEEDLPRLASVHKTDDNDKVVGVASGYLKSYQAERPIPLGGSGLISTLEDYGRFQAMLLAGGLYGEKRILKEETVALMLDPHKGKAQILMAHFGLGFMLHGSREEPLLMRYASWSGIARTYFVNDHVTETGSLLFTQTVPFNFNPGFSFQNMLRRVLENE
jgi:CubicO group peptidase (beta-lactamase class C family)